MRRPGCPRSRSPPAHGPETLDGSHGRLLQAQQQGYPLRLMVTGPRSHLTRVVYVYLPPQYFQPGLPCYRFPVIELIHGQPGEPQDWITVVGVPVPSTTLLQARLLSPPSWSCRTRTAAGDLAAVPQPGGRPAGPDLPGGGPAGPDRAPLRVQPPGPAGAWRATPRAGSAPPTWPCAIRTGTGSPGCSAATSSRPTTSWLTRPPGQPVQRQHQAGRRTPRWRRSGAAGDRGHPPVLAGLGGGRPAGRG